MTMLMDKITAVQLVEAALTPHGRKNLQHEMEMAISMAKFLGRVLEDTKDEVRADR